MHYRYIVPLYGLQPGQTHIAVQVGAERKLRSMAAEIAGTDGLAAIYIPEGIDDVYQQGNKRGRIVGGVKLVPMPPEMTLTDYFFSDWDGTRRWPIGWPCTIIESPEPHLCPTLRTLVSLVYPRSTFGSYAAQFQTGPVRLSREMGLALDRAMSRLR